MRELTERERDLLSREVQRKLHARGIEALEIIQVTDVPARSPLFTYVVVQGDGGRLYVALMPGDEVTSQYQDDP